MNPLDNSDDSGLPKWAVAVIISSAALVLLISLSVGLYFYFKQRKVQKYKSVLSNAAISRAYMPLLPSR
jgi:hypothetical protein